MSTYTTNLIDTITAETAKTPITARSTKAKQRRLARLVKHLEMSCPVSQTVVAEESDSYKLLSISALRDDCGWSWNDVSVVDEKVDMDTVDGLYGNSRKFLKFARDNGWLSEASKGKVKVEFSDDIIEIQSKNTSEPILALSKVH